MAVCTCVMFVSLRLQGRKKKQKLTCPCPEADLARQIFISQIDLVPERSQFSVEANPDCGRYESRLRHGVFVAEEKHHVISERRSDPAGEPHD